MLKEYKSTAVIISKHSIHSGRFCRQRHIFAIDVKLKRQKSLFYDLVRPLQWTSSPKDGALEPLSRHWWQRFIFPCVCVARCSATSGVLTCNYSEKCRNLFHTESRDFWLVHNCFPIFPSDPLWFPPSAALIAGSKWHARPRPPLQRGAARLLSLCVCVSECVCVSRWVCGAQTPDMFSGQRPDGTWPCGGSWAHRPSGHQSTRLSRPQLTTSNTWRCERQEDSGIESGNLNVQILI